MEPGEASMSTSAKLIFLCGKMAAGKSTLARDLAEREEAILLVQDQFLDSLYPDEITDFPGNTKTQRAWFRGIFERAKVEHELHFVDASDAVCKRQLKDRSRHLPSG